MRKEATVSKKLGIVSMLNFEKGYGFISCPEEGEEGEEYFFHASDVKEEGAQLNADEDLFETLNTGESVEFIPIFNQKLKKWKALGVVKVEG